MAFAASIIGTISGIFMAIALIGLGGSLWAAALGHVLTGAIWTVVIAASWPFMTPPR